MVQGNDPETRELRSMLQATSGLLFGSTIASINELRAAFPEGGEAHLLMLPQNTSPGEGWPFAEGGLWSPGNWEELQALFAAMTTANEWEGHETNERADELRDTCLVHHFHLDAHTKKRSSYRWFAFKDTRRFGNTWFNLGGTEKHPKELQEIWVGPEWMVQIKKLYPWVAAQYRIRGNQGIPIPAYRRASVRQTRHREPNCYAAVHVDDEFYICPGGGAREINLSRDQTRDRWITFVTKGGIFAKEMDPDPDAMMQQFQDAKWTADRLDGRGGQH